MIINMYKLYTNPMARLLASMAKRVTVILPTGKKLNFERGHHVGSCSYEGKLSKSEEQEYIRAQMILGF